MQNSILRLASLSLCAVPAAFAIASHDGNYGEELGSVQVHASCEEAAMTHLRQGIALLHHMTYEGADRRLLQRRTPIPIVQWPTGARR